MKKVYCDLHIFDLSQKIYVYDTDTGDLECVAIATIEELPEVINAVCAETGIPNIHLGGNLSYANMVSEDILAYSKMNYSHKNNLVIEVK